VYPQSPPKWAERLRTRTDRRISLESARAHNRKYPTDPGAISALAPARARYDEAAQPAPIEIWRRIMADQELARIEVSLRLMQHRQMAGTRLPRGPNLALSSHPALSAGDTMGGSDSKREKVIEWFARPPSLEPTVMPPPPLKPARNLHVSLILAIACFAERLDTTHSCLRVLRTPQPRLRYGLRRPRLERELPSPWVRADPRFIRERNPTGRKEHCPGAQLRRLNSPESKRPSRRALRHQ